MPEDKKNIFQKAVDAMSSRDEKAELEEVKAKLEEVKKEAEEAKIEAQKAKAEARQTEVQEKFRQAQEARKAEQKAKEEAEEAAKYIKHVWTNEDTYASLAFKHYGSIAEPYWRLIYEHNKEIIGDHPNHIRTGLEIVIPPLPDELKK